MGLPKEEKEGRQGGRMGVRGEFCQAGHEIPGGMDDSSFRVVEEQSCGGEIGMRRCTRGWLQGNPRWRQNGRGISVRRR